MKFSALLIHLGAWIALLGNAFPQSHAEALYDFMPSERYTIFREGLKQLRAGNPEAVQAAGAAKDMQMLWSYYLASWADKKSRAIIAAQLAAIPGHAQYAGDMVEMITTTTYDDRRPVQPYGGIMPRDYAFRILKSLGTLATPEAIQQIGRFLYDKRNPEMHENPFTGELIPKLTNSGFALRALNDALGDQSPIAGKVDAVEMSSPGQYSAQVIREWWASDASLRFRQPLPGVALPDIVKNPPKLPHVNLDRFKPAPPGPPPQVIIGGIPKVTPEAQAEADRMLKDIYEKPDPWPPRPPDDPYGRGLAFPLVEQAPAPAPMLDARWLYWLLGAALLMIPVWLAARRRLRQPIPPH